MQMGIIQPVAVILWVALTLVIQSLRDLAGGNAVAVHLELHVVLVSGVRNLRALVYNYPDKLDVVVRSHRLEYTQRVLLVLKSLCGCEQLVLPVGGECYLLHHAVDDNCKVRVLLKVDVLHHHRRGGSGEINVRIASRPCHYRALRIVKVYSSDILEAAVIRRDQFLSFSIV